MNDLSDSQLWEMSVKYGMQARLWRQKFLGLLPEIARRRLFEQHGFESLFVFAFKVGGVSEEQVSRVLNMHRKLEDKPVLQSLLVKGQVSVNKLARVVSVATIENQDVLADQVQLLSQSAIETLVRDQKNEESVRTHKPEQENIFMQDGLQLEKDVENELRELQKKGIDINAELRIFLAQRKDRIEQEKQSIIQELPEQQTRYISARIRKLITREHGTKCAISSCHKSSQQLHHTTRYALARQHNPNYMAPLCAEHHQIAHSIDVKVQERNIKYRT